MPTIAESTEERAVTAADIIKFDLEDKAYKTEFKEETETISKEEMKILLAKAKINTDKQLMAGEDCCVDYVLDAFDRERSTFGDTDASPDGIHFFVEQLPSSIAPWRAYAGRLKRKFSLSEKEAQMSAAMVQYLSDGNWKVKGWFEGYVKMGGFKKAFSHVKHLFWNVYRLEPADGTTPARTIEEFMDEAIGEGHAFRALPIEIDEREEARMEEDAKLHVDQKVESFRQFYDKIRRAGIHQISAIGSELYKANAGKWFYYEDASTLFKSYNERKDHLYETYGEKYKEDLATKNS